VDVNEVGKVCLTDALLRCISYIGLTHGHNDAFCQVTDRPTQAYGAGAAGAVFRDTAHRCRADDVLYSALAAETTHRQTI